MLVWPALTVAILACAGCKKVEPKPAARQEPAMQVITTESGIEMVRIPGGMFRMGSEDGQDDERPVHDVRVDAFWMDRTEVTQAQYTKLIQPNPAHFKGPNRPVEMIAWTSAALYCNKRSRAEGLEPCYDEETAACNFDADGYRLPTEAEWEYACRAGSTTAFSFGDDPRELPRYAWFADNADKTTHPVARKKPNPWGLFDMHGNVAEWCNDVYADGYYKTSPKDNPRGPDEGEQCVLRGGAWNSSATACRSAYRVGENPGFADACFAQDAIGFRCVRRTATGNLSPPRP